MSQITETVLNNHEKFIQLLNPRLNKYIPFKPTPKQAAWCLVPWLEGLYGGAAGPGKSTGLLMAAGQYVDLPNYSAILLRRTFKDLSMPGALIDLSMEWFGGSDARWDSQNHTWHFPSGAKLVFGHMEYENTKYKYQSAEFQFIGFDELTQFTESMYRFMFSRARRREGSTIPIRVRSATNPDGPGLDWVRRRFIVEESKGRFFLPATLDDNPHLDKKAYLESLMNLDPTTRKRILEGDWWAKAGGSFFRREWFIPLVQGIPRYRRRVRYWDLAASESETAKYTAGVRMSITLEGKRCIDHVVRGKWTAGKRDDIIEATARMDGNDTEQIFEQEPGSGGKVQAQNLVRRMSRANLRGRVHRPEGAKPKRAGPLASAAELGDVQLVEGPWAGPFLDELEDFREDGKSEFMDQVDAASGCFMTLNVATPRVRMLR